MWRESTLHNTDEALRVQELWSVAYPAGSHRDEKEAQAELRVRRATPQEDTQGIPRVVALKEEIESTKEQTTAVPLALMLCFPFSESSAVISLPPWVRHWFQFAQHSCWTRKRTVSASVSLFIPYVTSRADQL